MGSQNSKIDTSKVPIEHIKSNNPVEQTRFCPPFRKFKQQKIDQSDKTLKAEVEIEEPSTQKIAVSQQYYKDLEDAFDCKTKDIQLDYVLTDDQYIDLKTFVGHENARDLTLQLKYFSKFNSYSFNNILYEIHMNEEIAKLNCPNLNTITDSYVVETGLEVEGEENPNTQVYVLAPVATNLSEIIKYRRENKWGWTTAEFNCLAGDLTNALSSLHKAKISHNDIRPCNIFYSLEKNCYQLSCFANAVKSNDGVNANQVRTSISYGAPQLSTSKDANLQQADIYSLGMTLLSAFYLCQPVDRKAVTEYNKKYEKSYGVMTAIREMVMPIDKRSSIDTISKRIPTGENSTKMKNFIQSLRYKNSPKDKKLVRSKKDISEGYQRLGLWNDWKNKQYEAYELQENELDDFKKANSLAELAKIQSCRGDLQSASQYSKSASKIYRALGYSAYESGNANEALSFFSKATQCSKYFENKNDIDTARNLQGLALAHSEKGEYELCKPLIREANSIVSKYFIHLYRTAGKDSLDYCKIKLSEAKIETDFGQFDESDKILQDCLEVADKKSKVNQELGQKLKAQILQELGRNAMLNSSYSAQNQHDLISRSQRYLADSIALNELYEDNHLALGTNIQTFGEIQLRKQNFAAAKVNFEKAQQIRKVYAQKHPGSHNTLEKQRAESLCNIAACENGLGNPNQALKNYNDSLSIYRTLYGSDHNKYSAMAIGNMSKVYYKLNNKEKAKDCLKIATTILEDVQGDDDADYLHFKGLYDTL